MTKCFTRKTIGLHVTPFLSLLRQLRRHSINSTLFNSHVELRSLHFLHFAWKVICSGENTYFSISMPVSNRIAVFDDLEVQSEQTFSIFIRFRRIISRKNRFRGGSKSQRSILKSSKSQILSRKH